MKNLTNCKVTKKLNGYLLSTFIALFLFTNTAIAVTEVRVCADINVKNDLPSFSKDFPAGTIKDMVFVYLSSKKEVYSMFGEKDINPVTALDPVTEKDDMLISTTGSFKINNKIQYKLYKDVNRKQGEPVWRLQVSKTTPGETSTEDIDLNCRVQQS